jgi:hypothetical protein
VCIKHLETILDCKTLSPDHSMFSYTDVELLDAVSSGSPDVIRLCWPSAGTQCRNFFLFFSFLRILITKCLKIFEFNLANLVSISISSLRESLFIYVENYLNLSQAHCGLVKTKLEGVFVYICGKLFELEPSSLWFGKNKTWLKT